MSFIDSFLAMFQPETFRSLARQTRWLKRQGKIDAFDFLISHLGQTSALRLTLDAQANSLAVPVSRQAIHGRYTQEATDFFKASYQHVLAQALSLPPESPMAGALRQHFSAVYLLDSTSFDVTPSLKDLFPGCGGSASEANVKLLLRYEFIRGQLEPSPLLPGKTNDQSLAVQTARRLKKGQLQLQDKGFFDCQSWREVQAAGAFLVMPWPRSVTAWLPGQENAPETRLDVAAALAASTQNPISWPQILLGRGKNRVGPLRLVAFRLSPESACRHRAAFRESAQRHGHLPSPEGLELAGWIILLTNAPEALLPAPILSYLYRLRWQVELIFRQCKDTLRLDQNRSDNPWRVQCEIWARLLVAVMAFLLHTHADAVSWATHRIPISFEKVARNLQTNGLSLARALVAGGQALREELLKLWRGLLIIARKGRQKSRTNTYDRLLDTWLEPKSIRRESAPCS
jgi:hypothetical protein